MNQLVPIDAQGFTISEVERVALAIAKGGLFGSKDPNAILTLCLLAQAEGQHPAVVFRDYHIIQGKPAKKADAMLRDFITAGGKVEWHQLDDTKADATFSHPSGSARIDWTLERAKTAGLSTAMWTKYPRQMLRSRVISEGVRTVFPGATSGLYVPEEVTTFDGGDAGALPAGEDHEIIDATAEKKVAGIHKIKQAIRQMKAAGNDATTLAEFDAMLTSCDEELSELAKGNHSWWTGVDGDGNEFESIPAWIERRRAELAEPEDTDGQFAMLIQSMKECETALSLANWMAANEAIVEELDGAESRKFALVFGMHEVAIKAMDTASA